MNTLKFESEALQRFYGDSPDDIRSILNEFLSTKDEMLHSLQQSYLSGRKELFETLHFHSSVFAYVGFPQLSKDCVEFEKYFKFVNDRNAFESGFSLLLKKIMKSTVILEEQIEKF
jgi:HPt (histidine-containing phosphotransfer) domain-containing protein